MAACACGADIPDGLARAGPCPACLLRLALEPGVESDAVDYEPTRLLGPVGRGPHGIVHLAVRPDDDPQIVTVKVIEVATDPQRFCDRMRETMNVLESLRHPGIAEVVHVGVTARKQAYVVAAYVPGRSLHEYLVTHRAGVSKRVEIAEWLCSALADLHQNDVVHGSVKPANIIVCESGDDLVPILLDTGVVPALELAAGSAEATKARDEQELHALLADLLGDLAGLVEGTESPAALVEMFARRAR